MNEPVSTTTRREDDEATSKSTRRFIARCVHFRHALRPGTGTGREEGL
ncbi:hypothetical protein [Actinocorallia aurantiaca]